MDTFKVVIIMCLYFLCQDAAHYFLNIGCYGLEKRIDKLEKQITILKEAK